MNPGVPDIIAAQPISRVYVWLGGPQPKNGRGPAFFRDGDNQTAIDLNDEKNCWFDHRDQKGGGVLDLVQHVRGCDRSGAVQWLSERNGIELDRCHAPANKLPRKAMAVRESLERDGWHLTAEGYFTNDLRQVRYEHATKVQSAKNRPEKTFVWEHREGDVWFSGAGGRRIPLYLNSIARERDQVEEIVVVEGWMKSDALAELQIPACSSKEINTGTAGQFAGFQRIVIWPDRDAAGIKTAARAGDLIRKHNQNVYVIEPPAELPEGGDVIDAIALGWGDEQIRRLIASAGGDAAFGVSSIKSVADYANIEIRYVYPGMLAEGTVNVLSGDAGAGKSSYASFVADCVARDRQVLFCDRENPLPVVVDRFRRRGIEDGGNLKVWGGWCPVEAPGPDSLELRDWIIGLSVKPLLIWDSLISFHVGDENNASEVRPYMQGFRRLADLGACVLILHHSGKGESTKDFRGSSDIKAAIDSGWHLANFGEGKLERMRLRAWKCRYAVATDLNLTYQDGQFITDASSAPRTVTDQLIDLLREKPGIGSVEFQTFARDRGLGRDRARQFIEEGIKTSSVRRERGQNNAWNHFWTGEK